MRRDGFHDLRRYRQCVAAGFERHLRLRTPADRIQEAADFRLERLLLLDFRLEGRDAGKRARGYACRIEGIQSRAASGTSSSTVRTSTSWRE